MARFEFRLPDIGEGVSEGEIVKWLIAPGDRIGEDDPMVEVMTDKATVTIGAPKTGTVLELLHRAGTVARVGEVLVILDAIEDLRKSQSMGPSKKEPAATAVGDIQEGLPGVGLLTGIHPGKDEK